MIVLLHCQIKFGKDQMNKYVVLFLSIMLLFTASCSKMETNSDLVKDVEWGIDMSQRNKFKMSDFEGDWILDKVVYETYVDGVLTDAEDITTCWVTMEYSFHSDGTMYYGTNGRWTYSHNFLIWQCQGYYAYEVVNVNDTKLVYKGEDYPIGGPFKTFYQDKSGEHRFNVFEYVRK